MFFRKKPPHESGCLVFHIGAMALLLLAALAAFVGLVVAHYDPSDNTLVFGTQASSLSIIAFAVSLSFLTAQCRMCMSHCDVCAMPPSKKK